MSAYLYTVANAIDTKFDQLTTLACTMAGTTSGTGTTAAGVIGGMGIATSGLDLSTDGIMESPGTMFLLQQVMSRLKDAMAAIQAAGAVPGTALSAATQAFKQGLN